MKPQYILATAVLILMTACQSAGGDTASTSTPIATDTAPTAAPITETRTPCNVLPRADLEAIMGHITGDPRYANISYEGVGEIRGCNIDSDETASYLWLDFGPAAYYEYRFNEIAAEQVESIEGLGEAAFWSETDEMSGVLVVLNGDITFGVDIYTETVGPAYELAKRIAELTLAADPTYPLASGVIGEVDLCTAMPLDQIEAIMGKLGKPPFYSWQFISEIGPMEGCFLEAAEGRNFINIMYGPVTEDGGSAEDLYDGQFFTFMSITPDRVEVIEGKNYEAFWLRGEDTPSGQYYVHRGNIAMEMIVSGDDNETALRIAIEIAELAMRYIP